MEMTQPEADRYRAALQQIVQIGATPDTSAVGIRPDGEAGALWSSGGPEKALKQILQIARVALGDQ
jgi:hypothetical protein